MKKTILMLGLAACIAVTASAQSSERSKGAVTNKNGLNILPAAGDFALGIEASPFLKYLGNAFNSSWNSTPAFQGVDQMLYGKYFFEKDRALRAKLYLNIGSTEYKGTVTDDAAVKSNPLNSLATIVDTEKYSETNVQLSIGYEFRRGYGRLQGFYGAELGLGVYSDKTSYEYGNPMTSLNQTPSTWDFIYNTESNPADRTLEKKSGAGFNVGVNAFVGVEYFFARKMSIGGELGLGLNYFNQEQGDKSWEQYNVATNRVETLSQRFRNGYETARDARLQTNSYGNIFLMFHF